VNIEEHLDAKESDRLFRAQGDPKRVFHFAKWQFVSSGNPSAISTDEPLGRGVGCFWGSGEAKTSFRSKQGSLGHGKTCKRHGILKWLFPGLAKSSKNN